jgi:hypothetical protein
MGVSQWREREIIMVHGRTQQERCPMKNMKGKEKKWGWGFNFFGVACLGWDSQVRPGVQ